MRIVQMRNIKIQVRVFKQCLEINRILQFQNGMIDTEFNLIIFSMHIFGSLN